MIVLPNTAEGLANLTPGQAREALEGSFLRRVPALLESGLDMEAAIARAYEDEQAFLWELHSGTDWGPLARQMAMEATYRRLREEG